MISRKSHFDNLRKSIDRALDKFLPFAKDKPTVIHRAMRYSIFSGGKRIRPVIVLETCRACGGRISAAAAAACAVEFIHAYSLIHDDLPSMDNDDYRRGKPACHKAFGEANAILAGDALLTLAFSLIADNYDPKTAAEMIKELSRAAGTKGMVGGQALDINNKGRKIRKTAMHTINRLKTAKLFEASAKIGAIAAGAGAKKINAAGKYGLNLGIAFQLTDDIIDKDGVVRSSGCVGARRSAKKAIGRAKEALKIFGRSADRLHAIAEDILGRNE